MSCQEGEKPNELRAKPGLGVWFRATPPHLPSHTTAQEPRLCTRVVMPVKDPA